LFLHACKESAARQGGPASAAASEIDDEASTIDEMGQEGDELALPASPNTTGDGSPSSLLSEVDRELLLMRASTYVHRTSIDEASGRFDFDCSGFVGYALSGAAPVAMKEVKAATTGPTGRPLAKDFEGFFEALSSEGAKGHWRRVLRVVDLEPGDIIAWLKPADVSGKNTGHVVVVHGKVAPYADRWGAFVVPIADSTSVLHGRGDSRKAAKATGLGTGTVILVGDASGAPIAYRWSVSGRGREHECRIAMARLALR
jgi:hypothetical protein